MSQPAESGAPRRCVVCGGPLHAGHCAEQPRTFEVDVKLTGRALVTVEAEDEAAAVKLAEEYTDVGEANQWQAFAIVRREVQPLSLEELEALHRERNWNRPQ